jgi:hypothetical protein
MDDAKIYGVCISRLKHQIENARLKADKRCPPFEHILLESYLTGDVEEIIDILELYDVKPRDLENLMSVLEDLAYTLSVLTREPLSFGFTEEGHFGLYLILKEFPSARQDNRYFSRQDSVSV